MQETKFRVWDIERKEMVDLSTSPASNLHLIIDYEQWGLYASSKRLCGSADGSGILIQYVGLKDKNGKEICSGDIIKYGEYTGKIQYGYGTFMFYEIKPYVDFEPYGIDLKTLWFEAGEKIEVIGNVDENPELLEEDNAR